MNKYKKGYKKYREFIESFPGWSTVFCGYGYFTFITVCKTKKEFRDRWISNDIEPNKQIKKHKL